MFLEKKKCFREEMCLRLFMALSMKDWLCRKTALPQTLSEGPRHRYPSDVLWMCLTSLWLSIICYSCSPNEGVRQLERPFQKLGALDLKGHTAHLQVP